MDLYGFNLAKEVLQKLFKIKLKSFLEGNLKYHDYIELGIMPLYYGRYNLYGVLKIKAKELSKIRYKHPEAWEKIDNFMDSIENPLAIMISQNKNDPYTVIVLSDIISKDIYGNKGLISYFLRPMLKDNSILISSYKFFNAEIEKHKKGLKAVDKEKAERLLGVGVPLKEPAISILSNLSTTESIADLKNKVK